MTATKRITRILAVAMLVALIVSSMATFAMAAQACYRTTTRPASYTVSKKSASAIKITRSQMGTISYIDLKTGKAVNNVNSYGLYTIKVTDPKGKATTFKWDASKKSSLTLVGALKAKGTYTITVSAPERGACIGSVSLEEISDIHGAPWKWSKYPWFSINQ